MKCSNCGKEIKEDALFCNFCGTKVDLPTTDYEKIDDTSMNKDSEIYIDELKSSSNTVATEEIVSVDNIEESDYIDKNYSATSNKKKALIISGICLAVITVIILIMCAATSSSTSEMKKALESRDAYQVNAVYNDAYDKPSKLEKYDNLIGDLLNEVYNDLTTYDFYEEAKTLGYTIPKDHIISNYGNLIVDENESGVNIYSSISPRNISTWNDINSLIDCLEHYCAAVCMYENPDIYDDAYKNAISELNESLKIGLYNSKTNELVLDCANKYIEITLTDIDELLGNEKTSEAVSRLETAKDYLSENNVNSEELQNKMSETLSSYAKQYYDKAESYFKNKDINSAIGNIDVAIQLQPDNVDYQAKKDIYEQYIPFELYISDNCLKVDETGDFWGTLGFDKNMESNDNKQMNHSMRWYNNSSDSSVSINAHYNLEGKYDTVTGNFFLPKDEKDTGFSGWFEVYGDGKLIYTSPKMTGGVLPKKVEFKVTGVQKLKISFYGEGTGGFLSSSSAFALSDLIAQKDFPNDTGE